MRIHRAAVIAAIPVVLFLAVGFLTVVIYDPAPRDTLPGILGSAGAVIGAWIAWLLWRRWFHRPTLPPPPD